MKSVCVFLRMCVGREKRPHQVDPVRRTLGVSDELERQRKKAEEMFESRCLLRDTFTSSWIIAGSFRTSSRILKLETDWRKVLIPSHRCSSSKAQKNYPEALRWVELTPMITAGWSEEET